MPKKRLIRAFRDAMPSRESLAENRFVKPVAHRVLAPELWRFTRRSVPRGVALGLLVGIFLLIPGLQIAGAAMLALPFRANVPLAAAMTFLSNPATTPFILAASYYLGSVMLGRSGDLSQVMALIHNEAGLAEWTAWLLSSTAPVLIFGLAIISILSAVIGYFLSSWIWRSRVAGKWHGRQHSRAAAAASHAAPVAELNLGEQAS